MKQRMSRNIWMGILYVINVGRYIIKIPSGLLEGIVIHQEGFEPPTFKVEA